MSATDLFGGGPDLPASRPTLRYATYPPLIVGIAGFPKCPNNAPTAESSMLCAGAKRLLIQVALNTIWLQIGYYPSGRGADFGAILWLPQQPYLPMLASLARDFDAVRVWNFTAGSEAQVMVNAS